MGSEMCIRDSAGLLREGGIQTSTEIDLSIIATASGDGGVPSGGLLINFVDATMAADSDEIDRVRKKLVDSIGERGLVDAAAVMAIFQWNTRAADAAGILVEEPTRSGRNKIGNVFGFDTRIDGLAP